MTTLRALLRAMRETLRLFNRDPLAVIAMTYWHLVGERDQAERYYKRAAESPEA